jgi:LmbE family N-acetylglucosaminyl deacetylase
MNSPLILLAIFPHPDDETLGLGSTFARYSAEGVETHLVCATRGEMGWYDSEGPNPGFEGVGQIRTEELNCAAANLGLHSVNFLDYVDGYVDKANPAEIIEKLVAQIRRIKPQVVVTFAPDGAYGHPDHIALSQFTNGALVCAADKSFVDVDNQPPHRASKFYYMVDSLDIVQAANEAFGGISMEVDGVTRHHHGWEDWQITSVLDNNKYMIQVQRAVHCHKSQLPGYGPIGEWSVDELAKVFGVGYFYRAFSLINGGRKVERDLFEGLR